MVEATISMIIVSVLLVASLDTLGASRMGTRLLNDETVGHLLAEDLMAEILNQEFEEPVDTVAFGKELGESTGGRSNFDDVDDYHNWTASPPQHRDGTVMNEFPGWTRTVTVEYVSESTWSLKAAGATTVKRITVSALHQGLLAARISAIRCGATSTFRYNPVSTGAPVETLPAKLEIR